MRPIVELMVADFLTLAMDQLANQAAKLRYMTGGNVDVPMVLRAPAGAGFCGAAQHSQSLEAWVTHTPGLKVVYPCTSEDARGLLLSAIDDNNPVVFFENKLLYNVKCDVEDVAQPIPLGKARTVCKGSDITIITYGRQVYDAITASEKLAQEGVSVEIIDLRSLYPLDLDLIKASVSKTGKVLLLSEETKRGSYIGEIAAIIAEECFYDLRAPIVRVASLDTPIPFMKNMEDYYLPSVADIVLGVKRLLASGR
jgi:pyruvate dehydrogenase E1 component beta subunit